MVDNWISVKFDKKLEKLKFFFFLFSFFNEINLNKKRNFEIILILIDLIPYFYGRYRKKYTLRYMSLR